MFSLKRGQRVYVLEGKQPNIGNIPGTLTKVVEILYPWVYCEMINPVPDVDHNTKCRNKIVAVEHIDNLLPYNIEINAKQTGI